MHTDGLFLLAHHRTKAAFRSEANEDSTAHLGGGWVDSRHVLRRLLRASPLRVPGKVLVDAKLR
jgi:hypothetical protein